MVKKMMNEKIKEQSGCLILCGGKSRRMKRDKAKLLYQNESFLNIVSAKLRRTAMRCYLSLSDDPEEIPEGFMVLHDEVRDENGMSIGPMGGIFTGLRQCARDGLDGIFTVPVDLPLFETDLFDLLAKAAAEHPQADLCILVSGDERTHPTLGYYRRSVLDTVTKLIDAHDYRLMCLVRHPDVYAVCVHTENKAQDRMLFNVNTPGDYEKLRRKKHIVLQGEKGSGKSTLIRKIAEQMNCTIGGYLTRAVPDREKGCSEIYIYPADLVSEPDQDIIAKTNGKLCAVTENGVKEVCPEVFDTYGTELIHSASDKQLIIMDEIGMLEENSERFKKAVLSAFDGKVPVLASVKAKSRTSPFLETVRSLPDVQLIDLDEEDRDEIAEQLSRQFREEVTG